MAVNKEMSVDIQGPGHWALSEDQTDYLQNIATTDRNLRHTIITSLHCNRSHLPSSPYCGCIDSPGLVISLTYNITPNPRIGGEGQPDRVLSHNGFKPFSLFSRYFSSCTCGLSVRPAGRQPRPLLECKNVKNETHASVFISNSVMVQRSNSEKLFCADWNWCALLHTTIHSTIRDRFCLHFVPP
jgi:hypothetical protein